MAGFVKDYGVLITAIVSFFGVLVTSSVTLFALRNNLKMQKEQLKNQQDLLNKQLEHQQNVTSEQLEHQKEMTYLQHFLDKRTDVLLQFRRELEGTISILKYFHSDKADVERITKLKVLYKSSAGTPKTREDILEERITENDMVIMLEHALEQISPIEEKIQSLNSTFNMLSIYLEEWEQQETIKLISSIENFTHHLINGMKIMREKKNPRNPFLLYLVHIGEPYTPRLKTIQEKAEEVREILKPYLLIHRL